MKPDNWVIVDIECDDLNATKIWCAATLTSKGEERDWVFCDGDYSQLAVFLDKCPVLIGHNILGFDLPVLNRLLRRSYDPKRCIDTLVISQLINFPREEGHSLESYGPEAGISKEGIDITDWSRYSPVMLERCRSDVKITKYVLDKYRKYIDSPRWRSALRTEHDIAWFCNILHENGFAFDVEKAIQLRGKIDHECKELEAEFTKLFPPRSKFVRVCTPRYTKRGTISRTSIPRSLGSDLTVYQGSAPFSLITWENFNPGSAKQRIDRLWEAGWQPTEKTKGYKEFIRSKSKDKEKKTYFERYGWTTSDENLATLPKDSPEGIKKLVRWLLLISRVRRLDEWLQNLGSDNRIHGSFRGIGAWSHRMAHSNPNMGNIPRFDSDQPDKTPYSDIMRSLWIAGRDRYIIGVDAESIQLRVLAHYINDEEFTYALQQGNKKEKTDPHSVNQRALGAPCKSRDDAKTFIYAWLLGAGTPKIAEILRCSHSEAQKANDNFLQRYRNLEKIKNEQIPRDAVRGWFEGFDGRAVRIPGNSIGARQHLVMAGYLQNGEAIVMKRATQIWWSRLEAEGVPFWPVNFVHDEWQTETIRDMAVAQKIAEIQAEAIRQVGIDLNLRCPMAGSILSSHGKIAIGDNWLETH